MAKKITIFFRGKLNKSFLLNSRIKLLELKNSIILKIKNDDSERKKYPSLLPIEYPEVGIKSYAQNYEDVMLWRALSKITKGFYIDVGAWSPTKDSVSRGFYEKGWRGIHVEPISEYVELIKKHRPDELVYEAILGNEECEDNFIYHILGTGLSTLITYYAEKHEKNGFEVERIKCKKIKLSKLFGDAGNKVIHWLKIDVEGMELEVLKGWESHPARPWIVLIEATEPNSSSPTWMEFDYLMAEKGYRFSYFDGLNIFYIHEAKLNLMKFFEAPPNVFDNYTKVNGEND